MGVILATSSSCINIMARRHKCLQQRLQRGADGVSVLLRVNPKGSVVPEVEQLDSSSRLPSALYHLSRKSCFFLWAPFPSGVTSLEDPCLLPRGKPLTMSLTCKSKTLSSCVLDLKLVQNSGIVIIIWSHLWVVSQIRHLLPHPQVPVRWGSWSRHLSGFWHHTMW